MEGKYTLETFAKKKSLTKHSALNLLSKLKKEGYLTVSGGGRQKRIYTITETIQSPTNGFYDLVNRYSPDKLVPKFKHHVFGRYTIERAIIDGIKIGDIRTLNATKHLFRHVNNWTNLLELAKKKRVETKLKKLYEEAREEMRVKSIPKRYNK